MVIDFEEFRRITETLGGVEMTVYKEFSFRQWTFPEGLNYLDGDLALASIRARYDFADGHRHRMRNQQILVKAVISKLLTAGTLTSQWLKQTDKAILESEDDAELSHR